MLESIGFCARCILSLMPGTDIDIDDCMPASMECVSCMLLCSELSIPSTSLA